MERLWSPWRSQYIDSFKNKKENNCIFCDATKEEIEDEKSLIVEKGDFTFTMLNLYPYNNGHLMIIPYRHISDFNLLTEEESLEIFQSLKLSINALKIISNPDGFNIGVNLGKVAGAGIDDHIHLHIVPRWNGDSNFMPVIGEVKVLSQDLLQTKLQLIEAYKQLRQK